MCVMVEKSELRNEGLSGFRSIVYAEKHLSLPNLRSQRELDEVHDTPQLQNTPVWATACADRAQVSLWLLYFVVQYGATRLSMRAQVSWLARRSICTM